MTDTAIAHDIARCIDRLERIKANIHGEGDDYAKQRDAAMKAENAIEDMLIDMADSLNYIAGTGELSNTDRSNIRSYVYDGFIEAISAADAKMREQGAS